MMLCSEEDSVFVFAFSGQTLQRPDCYSILLRFLHGSHDFSLVLLPSTCVARAEPYTRQRSTHRYGSGIGIGKITKWQRGMKMVEQILIIGSNRRMAGGWFGTVRSPSHWFPLGRI